MAKSLSLDTVQVEMDSKVAYNLIATKCPLDHPCVDLVKEIVELASVGWSISFHFVYREANRSADCLARMGHGVGECMFDFSCIPLSLSAILRDDVVGVAFPRVV